MNRIAELRKQHGYSQSELAGKLQVAQNTLSQYETSRRAPSSRIVLMLAKLFDVTPNYLLGIPEANVSTNSLEDITEIIKLDSPQIVNTYLKMGWKLLHIGQESSESNNAFTVYTLGWYGENPAKIRFDEDECEIW